ncbi:MAG: hypothetical protein LUE99_12845 [Bacteroides sp.]|nr:hypothetical protein [Bacteroides sp.]
MEDNKIQFFGTVMVLDAAYLNFVISDLKKYFEPLLGRSLQTIDLGLLTMCLAMDAGLKEGENDVQILFVYDEQSQELLHCAHGNLKEELDGVAFMGLFGEFSFLAVPSEGFVSRGELFLDLLQIILNSADVKRLILASFNEEYGEGVEEVLKEYVGKASEDREGGKEIIQFRMEEPVSLAEYRWEMLGYPLMSALGIKSEDLQNN